MSTLSWFLYVCPIPDIKYYLFINISNYKFIYIYIYNESNYIMPYNSQADVVCLLAEQYDTKSNIKLRRFWSQLQASYVSSHSEALWHNETVCLWMTIYISNGFKLKNKTISIPICNWMIILRDKHLHWISFLIILILNIMEITVNCTLESVTP